MKNKVAKKINPVVFALCGLLIMLLLYFTILFLTTRDFWHPFSFFAEKWYLLPPMFLAFALQMFYLQKLRILLMENSLKMTSASVSSNTVAMIACCAHHLADLMPILGLFGLAAFSTDYQDLFLSAGLLINLGGVFYIRGRLKKHQQCSLKT